MATGIVHSLDVHALDAVRGAKALRANDIARIRLRTAAPIAADPHAVDRHTGSFPLIDPASGDTLTAGLIGGER